MPSLPALGGILSILVMALTAKAQDFAIEPLGFVSLTGTSTDGNFAVSGTMTPAGSELLSGGGFTITGQFQSVVPGSLAPGEQLIVNGSFENTAGTFTPDGSGVMSLLAGSSAIPGWQTTTAELVWVNNANTFGAATPFGTSSLDLTGYHDGRPYGGITQTIPTEPGRSYRLSLSLGSNADYPQADGQKSVLACAGSAGAVFTFVATNATGNSWETFSFRFKASAATTVITLSGLVASGVYLGLDNVSVVPDESSPPTADLVANGSFENACPFLPDVSGVMVLLPGSAAIPGWTTTTAELIWGINGNAFGPRTPHGSLFLDFTGYQDRPPYGGITQTLATTPNQAYQLSFALGAYQSLAAYSGPMSVSVTAGSMSNSFTFTPSGTGNQWETFTMNFTATAAATPLTFTGTGSGGGAYLGLDNVSVAPIGPELTIAAVGSPASQVQLSFRSVTGHSYSVQGRNDLLSGSWETLPGTEKTGTGGTDQITLPIQAGAFTRFLRLQVTH